MLFKEYPQRAIYGATLMITQSFLYNAIFFTYTLVLTNFYGVDEKTAPLFLIAFAVGNLAGPFVLGPPVRHRRPQEDDLRHVHPVRGPARDHRVPVPGGRADRDDPDDRLVRDLLLRLGGRQRRRT